MTKKPKEDLAAIEDKGERLESLITLGNNLRAKERRLPMTFNEFLYEISNNPERVLRDIFQLFSDMFHHFVPEGVDNDRFSEQSVGFLRYNCTNLFVNECEDPFFADQLFANRLMDLADSFRKGAQRNNIFLFEGPPGSGKSTFLNNLLQKLEDYARTPEGTTYKVYWKLNIDELGGFRKFMKRNSTVADELGELGIYDESTSKHDNGVKYPEKFLEFSCPNHDHPILMIPKSYRKQFLDELIPDGEFKIRLFTEKQYEWVLKGTPCNICNTLYNALLDATGEPLDVFDMIYARKNFFSRQLGECISVFNPGDAVIKKTIDNPIQQHLLNELLSNDDIRLKFSYLAKTNNGVLALMDIKENNTLRLKEYHGIISDSVHKVGLAEERINTLFLGLINPGDKKHFEDIPSFQDRIITVNIPYILDYRTEMAIYMNKFGDKTESLFMPRVVNNFAKIIISTRMDIDSPAIKKWIKKPDIYSKYLDEHMLLLKMELYSGGVPTWLSDEDQKRFDRQTRKEILDEARHQGSEGLSGRQSLIMFNKLLAIYADSDKLITMEMLKRFFTQEAASMDVSIPKGFHESLEDMYNYNVLQEVKEAVYYYNEEQLTSEILDYLFAVNFEPGVTKKCDYTGNTLEITEEYFNEFELILLGGKSADSEGETFRKDIQGEYVTQTLAQEMQLENKPITETKLYKKLFDRYTRNLKENSLAPYIGNDNFRRAIQDYGTVSFNAYDERLKRDVTHLISNLQSKFSYTEDGAKQISFYVLDRGLVEKY